MKKTVSIILAAFCLCSVLASCSKDGEPQDTKPQTQASTQDNTPKEIDAEDVAKTLLDECTFEGTLDKIDPAAIGVVYPGLPADAKAAVYMPGVTCADEVAVFTSADTAALEKCVKDHVAEQREGFASYMPEQLTKIDYAVIITKNGAVALVISDDAAAAKTAVEKALG